MRYAKKVGPTKNIFSTFPPLNKCVEKVAASKKLFPRYGPNLASLVKNSSCPRKTIGDGVETNFFPKQQSVEKVARLKTDILRFHWMTSLLLLATPSRFYCSGLPECIFSVFCNLVGENIKKILQRML